ncbi:MAG: hypothetical protein ACRDS0_09110 [Pseudonocardiaceae bacterium]
MPDEPATPNARGEPPGRLGDEDDSSSGRWRQQAAFSLFVDSLTDDAGEPVWRTRLYHEETGDETTVRSGALVDWVRWIVDRVGPVGGLSDAGGSGTGAVSVQILTARIVAGPAIGDGVEGLRVEAELLISGLSELRRALQPTVIEIVFGARAP